MVTNHDFSFRLMGDDTHCLFESVFHNIPNSIVALLSASALCEYMPAVSKMPLDDTTNIANEIAKFMQLTEDNENNQQQMVQSAIFFLIFLDLVQSHMYGGFDTKEFNYMLKHTSHTDLLYLRSTSSGKINLFPKKLHNSRYVLSFSTEKMIFDASGIFMKKSVDNGEFNRYNGNLKSLNIIEYANFCQWADITLTPDNAEFVDDVEQKVYVAY